MSNHRETWALTCAECNFWVIPHCQYSQQEVKTNEGSRIVNITDKLGPQHAQNATFGLFATASSRHVYIIEKLGLFDSYPLVFIHPSLCSDSLTLVLRAEIEKYFNHKPSRINMEIMSQIHVEKPHKNQPKQILLIYSFE